MAAWYGSKATTGLCQASVSLMPPHDVFPESHLGGGAIMKRKPPALRNIGIDLNRRALDGFPGAPQPPAALLGGGLGREPDDARRRADRGREPVAGRGDRPVPVAGAPRRPAEEQPEQREACDLADRRPAELRKRPA